MNIFGKNDCPEYKEPPPPQFPRFCSRCGSALVPEISPLGYDDKTGKPKFNRWLRCPNWEGGQSKRIHPEMVVTAAFLNATYDARLYNYGSYHDRDYLDCTPAYVIPERRPVKPRVK